MNHDCTDTAGILSSYLLYVEFNGSATHSTQFQRVCPPLSISPSTFRSIDVVTDGHASAQTLPRRITESFCQPTLFIMPFTLCVLRNLLKKNKKKKRRKVKRKNFSPLEPINQNDGHFIRPVNNSGHYRQYVLNVLRMNARNSANSGNSAGNSCGRTFPRKSVRRASIMPKFTQVFRRQSFPNMDI